MELIYHSGEIVVQTRAGVREMAGRVGRSIRSSIPPIAGEFLRDQPMAILSSVDADGRLWASALTGEPGFMRAIDEQTVLIGTDPISGDPLEKNLRERGEVGMLAIDFATRRRMRLNGVIESLSGEGILLRATQVYSNCPKYIQKRESEIGTTASAHSVRRTEALTENQRRWIAGADTFFIASFHPDGGADASHRGGNPGFVRVISENELVWPDYSGNNLFQTLGNISAYPRAGLLFIDFERGRALQITGEAGIVWEPDRAAEFNGAERLVEFRIEEAIEIAGAMPLRWRLVEYSPFNPT